MAQNMGSPTRAAAWSENCEGRPRAPYCCHSPSDLDRWLRFQPDAAPKNDLIASREPLPAQSQAFEVPQGRGSDDAVVRIVADIRQARL